MIDFVSGVASSNTQDQNWLMLSHPGIFEKIMLMIGVDSLEPWRVLTTAEKSADHGMP